MKILHSYQEIRRKTEKAGKRELNDYFIYRPIAAWILLVIKGMNVSPNAISTLSVVAMFMAGFFFWHAGSYLNIVGGVVWMNIAMVLDTLDGSYSRYKGLASEFGAWYDSLCDVIKFIILINALTLGFYLNGDISTQIWFRDSSFLILHKETILVMGLIVLSQFFLIYYIHGSRGRLSFNQSMLISKKHNNLQFYIGMETSLYLLISFLLLTNQIYLSFTILIIFIPFLWIFPWYIIYRNCKSCANGK